MEKQNSLSRPQHSWYKALMLLMMMVVSLLILATRKVLKRKRRDVLLKAEITVAYLQILELGEYIQKTKSKIKMKVASDPLGTKCEFGLNAAKIQPHFFLFVSFFFFLIMWSSVQFELLAEPNSFNQFS